MMASYLGSKHRFNILTVNEMRRRVERAKPKFEAKYSRYGVASGEVESNGMGGIKSAIILTQGWGSDVQPLLIPRSER